MPAPEIHTYASADDVAQSVAARLLRRIVEIQRQGGVASVVLTGGSIAVSLHAAVAASPARHDVDWGRVDVWFGDERFVPADSPDRNVGQAAEAMLDHLPVDPARVHPMAPSDGAYGDDPDAAAAGYADELARCTGLDADGAPPVFDILMLGIGPDGHCASLFPGHPALGEDRPVVAVRDSPKPPPTRITLTLGVLNRADEVWWVAAGAEKAEAVARAVAGADPHEVPAAGPKGLTGTRWFLDEQAASALP